MSLTAGARLGRYEIRSKIGAGGMGEVYYFICLLRGLRFSSPAGSQQ